MTEEIARYETGSVVRQEQMELSVEEIVAKVAKVKEVAEKVMKNKIHYGTIPGTPKPTLYKPGGEILGLTFRLAPRYEGERSPIDLGGAHREYVIRCELYHIHTGAFYGAGVGSCSTMESKYRFRPGLKEPTGQPVPGAYWDKRNSDRKAAQELLGGPGFAVAKVDGKWEIMRQGETVENPNPANEYNTVLKMASKRAFIDAILKATAASEVYTQDMEDRLENEQVHSDGSGEDENVGDHTKELSIAMPTRKSEAPAAPQAPVQSAPHGSVISDKQLKRIWAIGYAVNTNRGALTKDQIVAIIGAFGFGHANEITPGMYETVVAAVETGKAPAPKTDDGDPAMDGGNPR